MIKSGFLISNLVKNKKYFLDLLKRLPRYLIKVKGDQPIKKRLSEVKKV